MEVSALKKTSNKKLFLTFNVLKLKQVLFFVVFLKKKQLFVFKKMGDKVKLEQNGIVDNTDDTSGNNVSSDVDVDKSILMQSFDWLLAKARGIMGVEFADFGGIRRLSKMNLVDPTHLPTMLVDVQDRVHATLVRQLRHAITGDPDK